ncbi:MAG: hypothetical protein JXR94_08655, partial [Candidatus Hydrogenedentes bacterium]|nr:hypothetical protein [Candidatus Hydrogenedentota bacterium]
QAPTSPPYTIAWADCPSQNSCTDSCEEPDRKVHFDQRLVQAFMRCAAEAGTGLQPAVYDGACSDASVVYEAGAAPRVATVGIVRENSHGFEVARLSVFGNLIKTLGRAVEVI